MDRRRFLSLPVLTAGLPLTVIAQVAKPLSLVVPFTAGGSPDLIGRFLAERMSATFSEPVVVENKVGASGGIGTLQVSQAPADGRTLLMASTGPLTVNPAVQASVAYDPITDLEPVILVGKSALVLMVNNSVQAQTLEELVSLAKKSPGKLSYGSAGAGNLTNLVGELLKLRTGTDILHVPYKGTAALKPDVLAGRVSMFFDTAPAALPMIRAQQVRALAVTTMARTSVLPDLPTFAEAGIDPEFDVSGWFAVLAPKGTPAAVTQHLNRQINQILESPEAKTRFAQWGIDIAGGEPQVLRKLIEDELLRWREVVRVANIKSE